ncbi:MAG: hypothetical protein ACP5I7_00925, partial [Sulfolobales archaeon]
MSKKIYHVSITKEHIEKILNQRYRYFVRSVVKLSSDMISKSYRVLIVLTGTDPISQALSTAYLIYKYFTQKNVIERFRKPKILYIYRREFEDSVMRSGVFKKVLE